MARGDAAFRAVTASLFGLSVYAGAWLSWSMVRGFREANKYEAEKAAAAAVGGKGAA